MKLAKNLLITGGIVNALFFLFHLFLGWKLHQLRQVGPELRALLEMLNGGGALMVLFLAVTSLFFSRDALTSGLGRATLVLVVSLYVSRGLAEIYIAPKLNPMILATCLATGILYAVILMQSRSGETALQRGVA